MINFKQKEEKEVPLFYAKKLGNNTVLSILDKGFVKSFQEAKDLANFYWAMVAETAK